MRFLRIVTVSLCLCIPMSSVATELHYDPPQTFAPTQGGGSTIGSTVVLSMLLTATVGFIWAKWFHHRKGEISHEI